MTDFDKLYEEFSSLISRYDNKELRRLADSINEFVDNDELFDEPDGDLDDAWDDWSIPEDVMSDMDDEWDDI